MLGSSALLLEFESECSEEDSERSLSFSSVIGVSVVDGVVVMEVAWGWFGSESYSNCIVIRFLCL